MEDLRPPPVNRLPRPTISAAPSSPPPSLTRPAELVPLTLQLSKTSLRDGSDSGGTGDQGVGEGRSGDRGRREKTPTSRVVFFFLLCFLLLFSSHWTHLQELLPSTTMRFVHSLLLPLSLAGTALSAAVSSRSSGSACSDLWDLAPSLLSNLTVYAAEDHRKSFRFSSRLSLLTFFSPSPFPLPLARTQPAVTLPPLEKRPRPLTALTSLIWRRSAALERGSRRVMSAKCSLRSGSYVLLLSSAAPEAYD